jgi:hypothetical protein
MTTTLELHVRKIQWFCQQGEGFCMHVFSSYLFLDVRELARAASSDSISEVPPRMTRYHNEAGLELTSTIVL